MTLLEAAQEFFSEGLNPLPLLKNKAPQLPSGHPFLYEKINNLESRFMRCEKIGIACGKVSEGFYCIDFDGHDGEDIESVFIEFFNNETVQYLMNQDFLSFYKTPSGGFHCYLKYNEIVSGTTYSRWPSDKVMIEIRGNGQYAATFPSEGYEYVAGNEFIKLNYIEKEAFIWLTELASSFNQFHSELKDISGKSNRKWPDKWDDHTPDGKYNNENCDDAKILLKDAGWLLVHTRRHDGVELWQRPGKSADQGISATFGAQKNMFYCFSSNALPFKEQTAYTPFNIYTLLKFNGDWKAAKDSLKPKAEPIIEKEPSKHNFFPVDVFPNFIREYISELGRTLNFHPDFCAAAAMFAIATINGNRYKLRVKKGWEAPTIFWLACVGFPGAIKTHPVKTFIKPINKIDQESKKRYDEQMLGYDEKATPKQRKPKFNQILISDTTIEALHSIHDINKRGIGLYKDELKGFMNDMNKYRQKGSDEEFWLESFNNGNYIVNRATKEPIMINNICINIIGTIQHDVLNNIITQYAGNGLIDRFLFTASESKVYEMTDAEIDDYYTLTWEKIINKVHKNSSYLDNESTEIVKMELDAFTEFKSIDSAYVKMQNSDNFSQEIKNYLSKMKTYVPRFALLLSIMHSIENDEYIFVTKQHMVDAGRIADYFISTASDAFKNNQSAQDIKDVESNMRGVKRNDKIKKLHTAGFSVKEISSYFSLSSMQVYRILKD